MAQLVERNLAKVNVAGSNPVSRLFLYSNNNQIIHLAGKCGFLMGFKSLVAQFSPPIELFL